MAAAVTASHDPKHVLIVCRAHSNPFRTGLSHLNSRRTVSVKCCFCTLDGCKGAVTQGPSASEDVVAITDFFSERGQGFVGFVNAACLRRGALPEVHKDKQASWFKVSRNCTCWERFGEETEELPWERCNAQTQKDGRTWEGLGGPWKGKGLRKG